MFDARCCWHDQYARLALFFGEGDARTYEYETAPHCLMLRPISCFGHRLLSGREAITLIIRGVYRSNHFGMDGIAMLKLFKCAFFLFFFGALPGFLLAENRPYKTTEGCEIHQETVSEVDSISWSGTCTRGTVDGVGIVTYVKEGVRLRLVEEYQGGYKMSPYVLDATGAISSTMAADTPVLTHRICQTYPDCQVLYEWASKKGRLKGMNNQIGKAVMVFKPRGNGLIKLAGGTFITRKNTDDEIVFSSATVNNDISKKLEKGIEGKATFSVVDNCFESYCKRHFITVNPGEEGTEAQMAMRLDALRGSAKSTYSVVLSGCGVGWAVRLASRHSSAGFNDVIVCGAASEERAFEALLEKCAEQGYNCRTGINGFIVGWQFWDGSPRPKDTPPGFLWDALRGDGSSGGFCSIQNGLGGVTGEECTESNVRTLLSHGIRG